jgi:autotransporter-associated beta strand protein
MRIRLTSLCLMLLALLAANVQGAHIYWMGYDTDLGAGYNWNTAPDGSGTSGYPTNADIGVMAAGTATLGPFDTPPPNPMGELWMAGGATPGSATIQATTGVIDVMNWVIIGQGWAGDPDAQPGGTATLDLSGTAVFNQVAGGGGDTHIGESYDTARPGSTGNLILSGNAVYNNNHGRFNVGQGATAKGFVTIKDTATLNLNNEWHQLGFTGGVAQITQTGGTVNHNIAAAPAIADGNGWNPNGHLIVGGWGGSCTYDMSGGALNASSEVVLSDANGTYPGTYGVFNLNGGTVTVPGIQAGFAWDAGGPTTATFNFNGGLLRANASSPKFFQVYSATATMTVNVKAGGANIDTNGNNIAISMPLLDGGGGGGLVKLGAGNLKLNGINTYTGLTDVTAGTLGGSGTIPGAVIVRPGAGIYPGDPARLTVGSVIFEPDSFFDVYISSATSYDSLNVVGNLTVAPGDLLNVILDPAYVPKFCDTFDVLDWGTHNGMFIPHLPPLPPGLTWDLSRYESDGIIHVSPEPSTIVLLLIGAMGVMLYWRRHR